MGCPSEVVIGDNLVFSIATHDPDTGVLTDASAPPAYRIYEDETALAILTGTMAKLDDDNTTGFYTESVACTVGNGFEEGKTYTIYIEATVDGDTGGITFGFKAVTKGGYALSATGADLITKTSTFALAIADAIWDEVITSTEHNVDTSSAYYLRRLYQTIVTRVAQCADVGSASTIHLDESASSVTNYYKGQVIAIFSGTGAGQARACWRYNNGGNTKIADIRPAWATNPDATSWFAILNIGSAVVAQIEAGVIDNAAFAADVGSTDYATNIIALAVDKALAAHNLDHLAGTATGIPAIPAGTYLDQLMDDGTATYDRTTDSLQATRDALTALAADLPGLPTKNVALANFCFFMTLATDHVTGAAGLTVTGQVSLDGGAFANLTNAISEVGSGVYKVNLTAAEMNATVITLKFAATGADTRILTILTQPT